MSPLLDAAAVRLVSEWTTWSYLRKTNLLLHLLQILLTTHLPTTKTNREIRFVVTGIIDGIHVGRKSILAY